MMRAVDQALGIAIRFIRRWDVTADVSPALHVPPHVAPSLGPLAVFLAREALQICLSRNPTFGRPVLVTFGAHCWAKTAEPCYRDASPLIVAPPDNIRYALDPAARLRPYVHRALNAALVFG